MSINIFARYGDFLTGRKLDVGKRFFDPSATTMVDRIEYLKQICARKNVLHLGCLDHVDIIEDRIKAGDWLHGILTKTAKRCIGVDIDPRGRDLVRDRFGINNIELIDLSTALTAPDIQQLAGKWDLIVCAEMLEHITNHHQFLRNLHVIANGSATLIVTVPNAFYFGNFVNAFRGFESINTDHKYWFTFYTLSRLLSATGWMPSRLIYYQGIRANWLHHLCYAASRLSRVFAPGLILEAEPMDMDQPVLPLIKC
jgi:hypothetical protein